MTAAIEPDVLCAHAGLTEESKNCPGCWHTIASLWHSHYMRLRHIAVNSDYDDVFEAVVKLEEEAFGHFLSEEDTN